MNKFYIYEYIYEKIPKYIGKGKEDRYLINGHLRHKYLGNFLKKIDYNYIVVRFLRFNISEEEAFFWEKWYIWLYGRKDLGLGPLLNLTDGGEGVSGILKKKFSRETKRKMSISAKKWLETHNHSWKNKRHSRETKKVMSIRAKNRKRTKHTKETKEKMSIARKKWHIEHKNPMQDKHHSEIAKQKMREAWAKKGMK